MSATGAKALLRGSIETVESGNKAVAQGNLATMLQNEGKLAEALAVHEELYHTFEAIGARRHMTVALSQMGPRLSGHGRVR